MTMPQMNGKNITQSSIERILSFGTEEQKQKLHIELQKRQEQKQRRTIKNIKNISRNHKMPAKPKIITYSKVKNDFFMFYRGIIRNETGVEIGFKDLSNEEVHLIANYIKWLVDEPGEYYTRKSLYIWGYVGVGKSTLVEAGQLLLRLIARTTGWDGRKQRIYNMDEVYQNIYATKKLDQILDINKGPVIIDDLKEDHLEYNHFGNNVKLVNDMLLVRHNVWKKTRANTVITTNIKPKDLFKILDDKRLEDRMRQQYQLIQFPGDTKRN